MPKMRKEIVIPKDRAVFWMDKNGRWHNKNGEFRHKKIIDYFNRSIKKDQHGYYLSQTIEDYKEKVYFHYQDTALFVFDVIRKDDIILELNTGKQLKLMPRKLSLKADCLYMSVGEERVKFTERGLLKIADLIEQDNDQYYIRVKNRRYKIKKSR